MYSYHHRLILQKLDLSVHFLVGFYILNCYYLGQVDSQKSIDQETISGSNLVTRKRFVAMMTASFVVTGMIVENKTE